MKKILSEELRSSLHPLPICLPGNQKYFMLPITCPSPPLPPPSPHPSIIFTPFLKKSRNLAFRAVILKYYEATTIVFRNYETSNSHRRDRTFHSISLQIRHAEFSPFITDTKNCLHQIRHILTRTKPVSELTSLPTFLYFCGGWRRCLFEMCPYPLQGSIVYPMDDRWICKDVCRMTPDRETKVRVKQPESVPPSSLNPRGPERLRTRAAADSHSMNWGRAPPKRWDVKAKCTLW